MSSYRRPDITVDAVIKLYESGMNYRKIANLLHTESKIIISRLNECGITVTRLNNYIRQDVKNEDIKRLFDCGLSANEISKHINTTDVTICNRLKQMGIELQIIQKRDDINSDDIQKMYLIDNKSARDIGNKYGVSHTLILNKLKDIGCIRRNKIESLAKYARVNKCVICGKTFRPKSSWTSTSSPYRNTCSDECYSKHISNVQHEPEIAAKILESRIGGFWYGNVKYYEYVPCPLLTESLKKRVRDRFGHCALCNCPPEENTSRSGIVRAFAVHHALEEPLAHCETKVVNKENIRKMMPNGVAHFGEFEFTEDELWYVRLLVPLCDRCHGKVTSSKESDLPYEKTKYRKYFCELVINMYNGQCYI